MAGEKGIEVDVGITLTKILRQVATMEARLDKAAKKSGASFDRANSQIGKSFDRVSKSAEASANTFVKDMDRMRAKYDPLFAASMRYERELEGLNRAHSVGAINAQQHATALATLNARYANGASGAARTATAVGGLGARMAGARGQIQNAAFQIGDFAVQVGSGQRASTALAQQLPQLLGGFGALGAVLGAVVAIGVPIAAALFRTGAEAEGLETKIETLTSSVAEFISAVERQNASMDEVVTKYGVAAEAARDFAAAAREAAQVKVGEALDDSLTTLVSDALGSDIDLTEQFETLDAFAARVVEIQQMLASDPEAGVALYINSDQASQEINRIIGAVNGLQAELGLTTDQAARLAYALAQAGSADGPAAQADAAAQLQDILLAIFGTYEAMPPAARALADETREIGEAAAEVAGQIVTWEDATTAFTNQVINAQSGLSVLNGLAVDLYGNMIAAAGAAREAALATRLARAVALNPITPDQQDEDAAMSQQVLPNAASRQRSRDNFASYQRSVASNPSRAGGRAGAGGGGSAPANEYSQFIDNLDKEAVAIERRIQLIGKTDAEVARLSASFRMLDDAKRRNLDLDLDYSGNGETLRQEIERQSNAVGELAGQYEIATDRARFFETQQSALKDGLIDAIIEGENLEGVLANVAKAIAKAALQAALFNEGPLKDLFGVGGGLFGGSSGSNKKNGGSGGGGIGGFFADLLGFSGGGYTGDGGKMEPKGVVHGGEFVFSKAAVRNIGVPKLDAMHRNLRGYANGGLVGGAKSSGALSGQTGGKSGGLTVNIQNAPEGEHQVRQSDDGRTLDILIERKAIAAVTGPKGQRALRNTFGLRPSVKGN